MREAEELRGIEIKRFDKFASWQAGIVLAIVLALGVTRKLAYNTVQNKQGAKAAAAKTVLSSPDKAKKTTSASGVHAPKSVR